ncbi:MAG: discoidin domain-containing protein [Candidatus Zipacnadales bacterium]
MTPRLSALLTLLLVSLALGLTAPSLHAQVDLASARQGARMAGASSTLNKYSRPENLIDGNPATTWASARGKVEDEFVIVRLAGGRAARIGAVAIDNSVAEGHPPEAALKNFKIAVSILGKADEDFYQIKLGSCQLGGGRQVFTFTPARAQYVKIICRSNHGHPDWVEFAEIEVFVAGAPPVTNTTTPSVGLYSTAPDPAHGPWAALAHALTAIGVRFCTLPGSSAHASLSIADLLSTRVVIISSELPPNQNDMRILLRYCRQGGGLVCALLDDPTPLLPLLAAIGITTQLSSSTGTVHLVDHWITNGLSSSNLPSPPFTLTWEGSQSWAQRDDGTPIALAGNLEHGRLVILPEQMLTILPDRDRSELARRVVFWAAAMEDITPAEPLQPVTLQGTAVFLPAPSASSHLHFDQMLSSLTSRGLHIQRFTDPLHFSRGALTQATVLIAVMPAWDQLTTLDLAQWVRSGGGLLVLGDANATVLDLIRVNEFLREFGTAMTLSPARDLSVAIHRHPVTSAITTLSRPGAPLGVWCLQGTPLAEMGGTAVAIARTFGAGRLIAMDAGFAVDPVQSEATRNGKQPALTYGIHLEQNDEFIARCVAWLSGTL